MINNTASHVATASRVLLNSCVLLFVRIPVVMLFGTNKTDSIERVWFLAIASMFTLKLISTSNMCNPGFRS